MAETWREVSIVTPKDTDLSSQASPLDTEKYVDEYGHVLTDIGYLRVQTLTARKTYPVQNALVTLTRKFSNGKENLQNYYTDSSGQTPLISLPTLDRQQSLSPNVIQPYMIYLVSVVHPDYQEILNIEVNVFGGVVSLQQFAMLPNALRENTNND